MKAKIIAIILLVAVALVGCREDTSNEGTPSTDNETVNIKELVNDFSVGNKSAMRVSITSTQLFVTNANETEEVYELPEDEFYVSIAPYVNETHP